MKIFSSCSEECCVCALGSCCLAGNGDDDFIPAKKEKIIENLDNNRYPNYREYMIKYLKEKQGFDYIQNKESEGKTMKHNVTITKEENRVIEEYWVILAMRKEQPVIPRQGWNAIFLGDIIGKSGFVKDKKELDHEPTLQEIAQFLAETQADFVSVEHNYRFANLPFC